MGRVDIAKSASLIPRPPSEPPADNGPLTQVYVDGRLQATVPSDTIANPLSDFGADAGFPVNFDLIQLWQDGQTTTITLPPGTENDLGEHFTRVEIYGAHPAGDTSEIREKFVAQVEAAVKNGKVELFRTKLERRRGVPRPSAFARGGRRR